MPTIPSAYGNLGRLLPSVQQPAAPGLGYGLAVPNALERFGETLSSVGFNAVERDQRRQEAELKLEEKNLDTAFRSKIVAANQELDRQTQEISKRTDLTPSVQADTLRLTGQAIKDQVFDGAPPAMQHYQPTFQQQLVQSQADLLKAQDAAAQADALVGNIDVTHGLLSKQAEYLSRYNPADKASAGVLLDEYRQHIDETISTLLDERTRQLGPARAKATMEPVITAGKQQYLALQKGMAKASQDHVMAGIDLGIKQIVNSAIAPSDKIATAFALADAGWAATGKGQDELVRFKEKTYQDIAKDAIDKDFINSLPDGKHDAQGIAKLERFIATWDARSDDGKEFSALSGLDLTTRQSYIKQAQEKIKAERDRLAAESKRVSSEEFQLALKTAQDAMDNHEMPDPSLFATIRGAARTKMQRYVAGSIVSKANSTAFQTKAMANDPYRFTVSTMPGLDAKARQALLQPLNAGNMATLLPARVALAVKNGIPPLTADEAVSLVTTARKQGDVSAISQVSKITSTLPTQLRGMTLGFIADSVGKRDRNLGNAIALMTVDRVYANDYMRGVQLAERHADNADFRKKLNVYEKDFADRFASTGLSFYADEYARALDIYKKLMVTAAVDKNGDPGKDYGNKVLNDLIGEVVTTSAGTFGPRASTLVPKGIDRDKVLNFPKRDQAEMAKFYGIPASEFKRPLHWSPQGYYMQNNGEYVKDAKGRPIFMPFESFQ